MIGSGVTSRRDSESSIVGELDQETRRRRRSGFYIELSPGSMRVSDPKEIRGIRNRARRAWVGGGESISQHANREGENHRGSGTRIGSGAVESVEISGGETELPSER